MVGRWTQKAVEGLKLNQMVTSFFALDIGTSGIRVIQLKEIHKNEWALSKYAAMPVDSKLIFSENTNDKKQLAEAILKTIADANITTRNVAVGVPAAKVFSTVITVDKLPDKELANEIEYRAESFIPMPITEVKLDWSILGPSAADSNKVDVLIISVPDKYLDAQTEFLESLKLNVVAFEPDAVALTRAILPADINTNHIIMDCGENYTDMVLALAGKPYLMRLVPIGMNNYMQAIAQHFHFSPEEAKQYLLKYGVTAETEPIISGVFDGFIAELQKGIDYVRKQNVQMTIESILVGGCAAIIPNFAQYMMNRLNAQVKYATPWQNVVIPEEEQPKIAEISAHMAVAVGLAEREIL